MLRAVLLGALAVSAVACKSKDDAPIAQPGASAGKVVEVTGDVKIGAKPLAVGDAVKADDTIETGAEASVVVVLAHNNARWSVGPNRKVKASESAAWTAERGAGGNAEQDTSAAGRQAERSAADTAATAKDSKPSAEPITPEVAPGAPGGGERNDRGRGPVTTPASPTIGGHATATSKGMAQPPPPPPPPPPTLQPTETPHGDGKVAMPRKPQQALSTTDIPAVLRACVAAGTTLKLSVHIAAHVPTIKFLSEVDQKTKDCLVDAAKHMTVLPESGDIASFELTR
jgi:hypothetical protein